MGSALHETTKGSNGVAGGTQDIYGQDSATQDQLVTPWTFSVAR